MSTRGLATNQPRCRSGQSRCHRSRNGKAVLRYTLILFIEVSTGLHWQTVRGDCTVQFHQIDYPGLRKKPFAEIEKEINEIKRQMEGYRGSAIK